MLNENALQALILLRKEKECVVQFVVAAFKCTYIYVSLSGASVVSHLKKAHHFNRMFGSFFLYILSVNISVSSNPE